MVNLLERTSHMALDLLFPPRCALCRAGGSMLCTACIETLPLSDGSRCRRCWIPLAEQAVCLHCLRTPPAFQSIRAGYVMEGGARQLVHQLKYDGMTALAEPMAARLRDSLDDVLVDLVVPVPLHRGRLRSRGYNQSALLGGHLARAVGLAFDAGAARRIRATKPLAKSMHRDERRAIVAGAFAGRPERVDGRRILLVDDVVTTGATLDSCAKALLEAGAAAVHGLAFARAD